MLHFKLKRGSYRGRGRLVHRHGSQTTKKTNYGSRDNDNQHALKHSLDPVLTLEKVAKRCLKTQQRGDKEKKDYKLEISEFHHSL